MGLQRYNIETPSVKFLSNYLKLEVYKGFETIWDRLIKYKDGKCKAQGLKNHWPFGEKLHGMVFPTLRQPMGNEA